jgi:excinuclease ABC subunit B
MAADYLKRKSKMSKQDKAAMIAGIEQEMKEAARILDFERAAELRDMLFELKSED